MISSDFKRTMVTQITIKKDYILVEPRENEFWEIWETLGRLLKMPEYPDKNVIWIFREGRLKMAYDDLYRLRDLLVENFPENVKPDKKVALVVETGLYTALAKEYIKLVEVLPIEFKVFSGLRPAEDWILS
jgi:hypothetical protein